MILVASKSDLEQDRKVTRKQGEGLAEKYGIQFLETSAKDDSNIGKAFELLTREVLGRLGNEMNDSN